MQPNLKTVRLLFISAIVLAGFILVGGLLYWDQIQAPDLATILLIFAAAVIVGNGLFFLGCAIIAPDLGRAIIDDETKVKGPIVETTTKLKSTGDAEIDMWVGRYACARNVTGLSIIPVLILFGIFIFA